MSAPRLHVAPPPAFRLEARPSRIDGTGCFALEAIAARRKLGELEGELVSIRTARRRARHLARIAIVELDDRIALDATDSRAPLRFVNHGCRPNAFLRVANRRAEFWSLRPIAAGEELTADYGETHHGGTLACRCGAPGCRGFL